MFKYLTLSLTLFSLLLSGYKAKKETPQEVLLWVKNKYDKHNSISYSILYRQKFFSGNDTMQWKADCQLIRNTKDSILGGTIWFKTSDSIENYYNLNQVFSINHPKKHIDVFNAHENQTGPITGNIAGNVIRVNFLKPGKILSAALDTNNQVTMITEKTYYLITINYAKNSDFSDKQMMLWVNKKSAVIEKIKYHVKYQEEIQYNEWNLTNIRFDKSSTTQLDKSLNQYLKAYSYKLYIPPSEKDFELLPNGSVAPSFTGKHFQDNQTVSLDQFKGKMILLDFSYMSCAPCVEAIPHLIELKKDFEHKNLVVLALNSNDNRESHLQRMPGFIAKHAITYPMVMTNRTVDSLYQTKVYPTFYLIDKQGKIIHSNLGFSTRAADTLRAIITRNID